MHVVPLSVIRHMNRAYGSQKFFISLFPRVKTQGYHIDRAYGSAIFVPIFFSRREPDNYRNPVDSSNITLIVLFLDKNETIT